MGGQNVSYYDLIKDIKNKSNKFFILFKLPNFLLKLISPCLSILSKFSNKFFLLKKQIDYSKKAITSFTYLSSKNSVQNLKDELTYLADNCQGDDRPNCPILDALSNK